MHPTTSARVLATILTVSLVYTACAPVYLAGRVSPEIEPPPTGARPGTRPTVAIVVRGPDRETATVERLARESGLFATVWVNPDSAQKGAAHYMITMSFDGQPDHGGVGRVLYLIFGAALTLGVLPIVTPTDVVLNATVTDRDGNTVKTYRFEGRIYEVHQVAAIFLPLGWVMTPNRAGSAIVENLVKNLYRAIDTDQIIALAPAAECP